MKIKMAVQRRNFRERKDCLGEYSNAELIRRFRLDSNGINFVEYDDAKYFMFLEHFSSLF